MSKRNFILLVIIVGIVVGALLVLLFVNRGAPTPPSTDEGGTNFFSEWFGGGNRPIAEPEVPADISGYEPSLDQNSGVLNKVSTMPIAGYGVFLKERYKEGEIATDPSGNPVPPQTELAPAVRYIAKENGNVYQTFSDDVREQQFSTTVIPRIEEAYIAGKGDVVIMRKLKSDERTIETFVGLLPKELLGGDSSEEIEVKGFFLPDNITDLSVSPDSSKVFYLFQNGEITYGTILEFATDKKTQVFDSPFNEWLSVWTSPQTIFLNTKASSLARGYTFALGIGKSGVTKVIGDVPGLTSLGGPDGKKLLYGDSSLSLNILSVDTNESRSVGLRTLPEKCAWSGTRNKIYCAVPRSITSGSYPDSWYRGEVSFSDQIWSIDVETGALELLLDPVAAENGEEIDGIKLSVDSSGRYLFFVNKRDSFLWKLNLN